MNTDAQKHILSAYLTEANSIQVLWWAERRHAIGAWVWHYTGAQKNTEKDFVQLSYFPFH